MKFEITHIHKTDDAALAELRRLNRFARAILQNTETTMVDTSKLLEAVERQKTESASLRELAKANHAALVEVKSKLADATAKLEQQGADTAALEKVQHDIDKAVADLDMDNAEVQEVLEANVDKSQQGGTGGQQGGGSGSAQPLPGTGVEPPPAQPEQPQGEQQSTEQPQPQPVPEEQPKQPS